MNSTSIHLLALVVVLCEVTAFVVGSVETGAFVHLFEWKWSEKYISIIKATSSIEIPENSYRSKFFQILGFIVKGNS